MLSEQVLYLVNLGVCTNYCLLVIKHHDQEQLQAMEQWLRSRKVDLSANLTSVPITQTAARNWL